ncbi:MAG: Gfo/Idh/MocA family protein [Mycobacterium sp.]
MTIGVGLAGLGVVSRYYLRALSLLPEVRLAAVCDIDPQKLQQAESSGMTITRHLDDLVHSPEVEAVVIALPNSLHAPACRLALEAGKHVCCEKPLAQFAADAESLVRAAQSASRILMTSFHRRYNANFTAALAAISGRHVSRVDAYYLECVHEHSAPGYLVNASANSGCIADNGSNVFDLLTLLLQKITSVNCRMIRPAVGVEMSARLVLEDEAGAVAAVELDWEYIGERKWLDIECQDGFRISVDLLAGSTGFKTSLYHEYELLVADFASRIRSNTPTTSDVAEVVTLVEAAYRSAASLRHSEASQLK